MDILSDLKNIAAPPHHEARPEVTAIIVAAGRGERMHSKIRKQFMPLCGISVIDRTLSAFEASRLTTRVIVVVPAEDIVDIAESVSEFGFDKVVKIVGGGETRQQSAQAGLEAAGDVTGYIAVHDGARPLVTPKCIDRVIDAAFAGGAAAAAVRVKDTVKLCGDDGYVIGTPERSNLWAVQTPQVFRADLYREAMARAVAKGSDFTDDCQLIEDGGGRVLLTEGEYTNIKITTADDVIFAEAILRSRGEA